MPPLDPLIIQSFPAPPTHIPPTPTSPNPPPSRPPSTPLPPLPGPSRIHGHESFYLLSNLSTRTRRASKLSLTSLDGARSRRISTVSPPLSPLHAVMNAQDFAEERDRSDHEDVLFNVALELNALVSDADPETDLPSPMASPPRTRRNGRRHQANESISSIDMRDIIAATADCSDTEPEPEPETMPDRLPSPSFNDLTIAFPAPPTPPRSSPSPDITAIISATPRPSRSRVSSLSSATSAKDRAKRHVSDGLRHKSKPEPRASEPLARSRVDSFDRRSWIDHDEFGRPIPIPLSESPLPVGDRSSYGTDDASDVQPIRVTLDNPWNGGKDDEDDDDGHGSDSSIDLHTPLPHLMVKHGLLSPRSKLFGEQKPLARDSVFSISSTKTGSVLKDSRDTEKRRTRHRDGRLLRGGIGLTTGLGWSDSEDEDAPSALTRRISTLNLTRRSTSATFSRSSAPSSFSLSHSTSARSLGSNRAPSTLSQSSTFSQFPPSAFNKNGHLTRSLSSGTLLEESRDRDDPLRRQGNVYDELDEWGVIDSTRWSSGSQSQTLPASGLRNSASSSTTSSTGSRARPRKSSVTNGSRLSGGMGGVGIPEDHEGENEDFPTTAASYVRPSRIHASPSMTSTRSSTTSASSTQSIPMPATPKDDYATLSTSLSGKSNSKSGVVPSMEKSLPPLPPSLRRVSGNKNLSGSAAAGEKKSGIAFPRATTPSLKPRPSTTNLNSSTTSNANSTSNIGVRAPTSSIPAPGATTTTRPGMSSNATTSMQQPHRPLRLASSPHLNHSASSPSLAARIAGDRAAVPVPSIPSSTSIPATSAPAAAGGLYHQIRAPSVSLVPGAVGLADAKPRPRTGTGMVYRNTGGPSRLRLPSALGSASGRVTPSVSVSVGGGRI